MELINNFPNLSKILSEKFALKKSDISLYLLVLIENFLRLNEHSNFLEPTSFGNFLIEDGKLNSKTFRAIKDSGLVNLKSFGKNEIRSFSEFLIKEYLKATNTWLPSSNFIDLIVELATQSALELHSPNNDEYTEWCIYIANIGRGDLIIKLNKQLEEKGILENCYFIGVEPDEKLEFLTNLNYFIHNISQSVTWDGNPLILTGSNPNIYGEVQIAISIPPFTNIPQQNLQNLYKLIDSTEKIHFSELAFIELMLKRVSEQGKVIALVRNEFLSSKKSKFFREKYLRNDWIEKIIALPREYANYLVDISVIVFNKIKLEKGFIVFDGLEDKYEKAKISVEDVFSNDADLRVNRYAVKEGKEIASILSNYPQDEVKKIKDLVTLTVSGHNYSPNDRISKDSTEVSPYVRVADLSKNETEFDLDISKVERKISPEKAYKRTIIDFSAVLISRIAPKLKPTYFNFTGQSVVIGSDVIALKLKKNINPEYFLSQLHSQFVQIQVKGLSSGVAIPRIRKEDLLNIEIILPSWDEQNRRAIEFFKKTQKEIVEDIIEVKQEVKNTEYDVIRIAIHDFNQKLGAMQNDLSDLKRFFEEKLPNFLQEPIKPVFEDDTEEQIDQFRLGNVLQRLINTRNEASAQISKTREELQDNTVRPVIIRNLKEWFETDIKPLYQNEVNFEVFGKKVEIEIDTNRFKRLVRNLVTNAKQYNAKTLVFDISYIYLDGEKKVRILYKNNGEPFPKDFDFDVQFKGLYQKSSKSKGWGIGGFSVNRTIELHSGEMKNVSPRGDQSDLFPVQIEIILPIDYKPNPNYVKTNSYSIN